MKKRKKLVYKPKAYWKETVGFDIEKEFEIYKYLCGTLRSKRKINRIDEQKRFRKYNLWKKYVEETLQKCDVEQLEEFYHFLKLNKMECEMDGGMNTSLLVPLIVALISGVLVQSVFSIEKVTILIPSEFNYSLGVYVVGSVILYILGTLLAGAMLMGAFWAAMKPFIKNKYRMAFWRDYIGIVKAAIKEKNKQKENEESKG